METIKKFTNTTVSKANLKNYIEQNSFMEITFIAKERDEEAEGSIYIDGIRFDTFIWNIDWVSEKYEFVTDKEIAKSTEELVSNIVDTLNINFKSVKFYAVRYRKYDTDIDTGFKKFLQEVL